MRKLPSVCKIVVLHCNQIILIIIYQNFQHRSLHLQVYIATICSDQNYCPLAGVHCNCMILTIPGHKHIMSTCNSALHLCGHLHRLLYRHFCKLSTMLHLYRFVFAFLTDLWLTLSINLRCRSYNSLKDLRKTRNLVHLTLYSVSSITWHRPGWEA